MRGQEQTFEALPRQRSNAWRCLLHDPPDDPTAAFLIGSHGVDQARAFRKHRTIALQLAGYLPVDGNGEEGAKIPVVAMSMTGAKRRQDSVATIALIVREPENGFRTFVPI